MKLNLGGASVASLTIIAAALAVASQPAKSASVFICDFDVCANGVRSPDPYIKFTTNGFNANGYAGSFQVNSMVLPDTYSPNGTRFTEAANNSYPSATGAVENDFSATWKLPAGINIVPTNQTIFFYNRFDPAEANRYYAVSDVLHFTYSQDTNNIGHLDGSVYSDTVGYILVSDLAANGIYPTGYSCEACRPVYDFSNTGITAKFQSDVPEIDAASGTGAIGLLLGAMALAGERRRRRAI